MKFKLLIFLFLFQLSTAYTQTTISGRVSDQKGEAVPGANIYFEGTFEGCTSDSSGHYSLTTSLKENQILTVSFIGYETFTELIELKGEALSNNITLSELKKDLGEVVITVGTFAAGDESKSPVLSTLDLATSSGGFGDISRAISSLPGTSNAADEGGLMVRGGERYETSTIIDGMAASDAFTAKMPNVPVRGRFSPMLFRGTVFSTGGYSAEYGQALSSLLILNTIAMPKKDELFVMAHSSGLHFSATKKWERTAFTTSTGYNNMGLLYKLVNSNIKWQKAPVSISQNLVFRQKIGQNGMLKAMGAYGYDNSSMYYRDLNSDRDILYALKNHNYFAVVTYTDQIGEKWILHSGLTLGRDDVSIGIQDTSSYSPSSYEKRHSTTEMKLSFSGPVTKSIRLNMGTNLFLKKLDHSLAISREDDAFHASFDSPIGALYAEAEIKLSKRFSTRIGARFETLSLTRESYISPRLALACKTSQYSQISLGYGQFYQQAQDDFLIFNPALKSEKADHLIANFQYERNSRIFRLEAYYKVYDRLVKYDSLYALEAHSYNNHGDGYAQGMDLFFRDSKTLRNGDFWLSYSLMNSERNYLDYKVALTPFYLSRHTLSIAYKHYIELADTYLSAGYTYSSGRSYIDPNISSTLQQKTIACHNLDLSIYHFTELFGKFTMLFAQISNVLGSKPIYGYRFASIPDPSGIYRSEAILPVSKRFFMVGIHISFSGQTDI